MKFEFEIPDKKVAWLKFLDCDEETFMRDLMQLVRQRVDRLIWNLQTGEEDVCVFCNVSAWFFGHRQECKLHPDNLPEELK